MYIHVRCKYYVLLPPSHFFGVPFLEKEDLISGNVDLISGNVASIVGNGQKKLISNYGSNISRNEIFLFQKWNSKKVGQRKILTR